jgi:diguanylate cyclase (GGDEF)-like protein
MTPAPSGLAGPFFDACPLPGLVLDAEELRILAANPAALRLYGYSLNEILRMTYGDLSGDMPPEWQGRVRHHRKDGSSFALEATAAVHDLPGAPLRVVILRPCACDDEQELRTGVMEMLAGNQPLESVLAHINELLERRFPELRAAVLLLTGDRLHHVAGGAISADLRQALDGLPIGRPDSSGRPASPYWGEPDAEVEIANDPRWERWRDLAAALGLHRCCCRPMVSGAGEILGVYAVYLSRQRPLECHERQKIRAAAHLAEVAVEQRNMVRELTYQAYHDAVTRLPNRALFDDRLQQAWLRASRESAPIGFLHIHADRMGVVTDLLGRNVCDLVLEQVARRMESVLGPAGALGRIREQDFAAILPGTASEEAAVAAERVRLALLPPLFVMGHELSVTASIGIAVYPGDGADPASLALNAGAAAEAARRNGRNCVCAFHPELSPRGRQRLVIESELGRAIGKGELHLLYQPQFAASGRLVGAEALLRWKHPEIGMVSPAAFIPVAEESGLIVRLGRWVMVEACRQAARWAGAPAGPVRVAVNASSVQFRRDGFVEMVAEVLRETKLDPSLLEIELTESALAEDLGRIAETMDALLSLGVKLALDDFGTGYSSLSQLQRLPVHTVKIDRTFTQQIELESDRPPLVCSIVALARALGKTVVAEGVETDDQRAAIGAMGCEVLQGFRLGRPADAKTFAANWLAPSLP